MLAHHQDAPEGETRFGNPPYGSTRSLGRVDFAAARKATEQALAAEGFGVLTAIDVRATLKKKLDVDRPAYVILGACNPALAHRALTVEPAIGLLLPCNVIVAQESRGNVVVSAIDPVEMFRLVDRDDVEPLASEVKLALGRALAAIEVPST